MPKVLITGGSGFIAAHLIDLLLERGYEVVTTVRSEAKAAKIREAHPGAKLTIALVPDISKPDAFDEVIKNNASGLEYVLHPASPNAFGWKDVKTEVLDPALEGTRSVLRAVKNFAPSVRRVVVTSSFAAVLSAETLTDPNKVYSEADWNPLTYEDGLKGKQMVPYRASKTIAERAAWDFVASEKPNFDLVTVNPVMVFGPIKHHVSSPAAVNSSNQRVADLILGKWKTEVPPEGIYLWVDVRDVTLIHANALEHPEAGGKRFFAANGNYNNREILKVVRKNFPQLADRLPDDSVPGGGYPEAGIYGSDNSRATKILGIDNWVPFEKSIVDTVNNLIALGA